MEEIYVTDHDSFFNINGELIPTNQRKSTTPCGEKIKINKKYYTVVSTGNKLCCDNCSFLNGAYCNVIGLPCAAHEREDDNNVIFQLIIEREQREFNGLFTTEDLKAKLGYKWK